MNNTQAVLLVAVLSSLCAIACGGGSGNTQTTTQATTESNTGAAATETTGGETPPAGQTEGNTETTTATPAAPSEDPAAVAAGNAHYTRICANCHGDDGAAGDGGPAVRGKRMSVEAMRRQIREGSGNMRPIPVRRLSDADLDTVIAYLVTIEGVVR